MLTSESCLGVMIIECELATSTFFSFEWSKQAMAIKLNNDLALLDLWEQDSLVGEGGGLGSVFTGYVLLVSQSPCPYPYPNPIVVFSVINHILHRSHFLSKCNFHNLDLFTWSFKLVSMWSPLYDEYLLMFDHIGAFVFFFFLIVKVKSCRQVPWFQCTLQNVGLK